MFFFVWWLFCRIWSFGKGAFLFWIWFLDRNCRFFFWCYLSYVCRFSFGSYTTLYILWNSHHRFAAFLVQNTIKARDFHVRSSFILSSILNKSNHRFVTILIEPIKIMIAYIGKLWKWRFPRITFTLIWHEWILEISDKSDIGIEIE